MLKTRFTSLVVAIAALAAGTNPAFGWGQNGHRITAEIGERNTNEQAQEAIRSILGQETLAEIATWPDDIRSDSSWDFSQPWHFLSIDDQEDWQDLKRAPQEEGDVLAILETLEEFLSNPNATTIVLTGKVEGKGRDSANQIEQQHEIGKREALAFYVHFVGDIHQPLHVGRREDFGGNKVGAKWFGEETNLHKIWDESLIESTDLSFTELATFLNRVSEQDKQEWTASTYLDWAKESKEVRWEVYDFGSQKTPYYLNVKEMPVLGWAYRHKSLPIIQSRLAKGGIRLAAKLNEIFAQ